MQNAYLLSDVCKASKITPGRIQNWLAAGWIKPSIQVAQGSGSRNKFSYDDIIIIEMLRIMIEMGVPRKYAGEVAKEFQDNKLFRQFVVESKKVEISYFEIFVGSDGKIRYSAIQRVPGGFWETRRLYHPTIVYSIDLKQIIKKVELALDS